MKNVVVIGFGLLASSVGSMAQGLVQANNPGTGVYLTVSNPAMSNGAPVKVGTPAVNAGFAASVGLGEVTIEMFAAPNGTPLSILETSSPIATTFNSLATLPPAQGTFNISVALQLTTAAQYSTTGGAIVAGWDGVSPLEFIYSAVSSDGTYAGWSSEGTNISAAPFNVPPTHIFGSSAGEISSFNMVHVPEADSTLGMGLLSAAVIYGFRRRVQAA